MKLQTRIRHVAKLGAILTVMTACATPPPVENFATGANPADEIQKLEAEISAAAPSQLDVLSPRNYEKSISALRASKKELASQSDAKDILEEVAESRSYLKRAQEFAKVSTETMPDVTTARALALKEGAKESFSSEFRKADNDLKNVAEDIESNDLDKAQKERGELQAAYLALELSAIQRKNLAEAQGILKDAKRADAEDIAPQTLAKAEKSIRDADAYIIANRHDTAQIQARSAQALADARYLAKITGMAKSGERVSGEAAALQMDAAQVAVAQKTSELAQTEVQLSQAGAAATAALLTVETQKAMDAKYEQARAMFKPSEAEVYRQGKMIVIRLRTLDFDSAKAQLKGSSFPLLSKVNEVIAEFPTSRVTVEGHTDSKGGKAVNEKVSLARAEAVKSYFESNSKSEGAKYSAVGYDFQKPLATNKTEAGRAQNRRVDIIIAPEIK